MTSLLRAKIASARNVARGVAGAASDEEHSLSQSSADGRHGFAATLLRGRVLILGLTGRYCPLSSWTRASTMVTLPVSLRRKLSEKPHLAVSVTLAESDWRSFGLNCSCSTWKGMTRPSANLRGSTVAATDPQVSKEVCSHTKIAARELVAADYPRQAGRDVFNVLHAVSRDP